MEAILKNGKIVSGKKAEIFVKIGIAKEIEMEPIVAKKAVVAEPVEKQIMSKPVTKVKQRSKTKKGRPFKK